MDWRKIHGVESAQLPSLNGSGPISGPKSVRTRLEPAVAGWACDTSRYLRYLRRQITQKKTENAGFEVRLSLKSRTKGLKCGIWGPMSIISHKQRMESSRMAKLHSCGADEARTRDPRRDRPETPSASDWISAFYVPENPFAIYLQFHNHLGDDRYFEAVEQSDLHTYKYTK